MAALLCSELRVTRTFQQRREDWGPLRGFFPRGSRERRPSRGRGLSLKDGEFVVKNKALPGSCCFSTSAGECTFPSCSDSVFLLLLLFYIVTKSRKHKIYYLAILKHTVNWYQIHSHCYATSSTIPPWDISHPVQQKLSIYEVITAPRSPWQPPFNLPSPCI